jgi:hypothetical protein
MYTSLALQQTPAPTTKPLIFLSWQVKNWAAYKAFMPYM